VRWRFLWALGVVAVLVAAYLGYLRWGGREPLPEGLIQANGRIEGDHLIVAPKYAGRIAELLAREGDTVENGEVLARLDDARVRAQVAQGAAEVAVRRAAAEQARAGVGESTEAARTAAAKVKAGETALAVARKEVPLSIETAEARVAAAEAQVARTQATAEQAERDLNRSRDLARRDALDVQATELAELALKVARSDVDAAKTALTGEEKAFAVAKLGWDRLKAREDDLEALKGEELRARAAVRSAEAAVGRAEAEIRAAEESLAEAQSVLDDLSIHAPAAGVIVTRMVDVGEVVAAGAPLLEIVDLDRLYLKVYVPEFEIGKLRRGLKARIFTDAFPDEPFPAEVRYIASQAEFTPKEVQTREERVKLVYAVRLYLEGNPDHRLTPGLPADAMIRWREEAAWVSPRW
jgi:HlyD family secretion protein